MNRVALLSVVLLHLWGIRAMAVVLPPDSSALSLAGRLSEYLHQEEGIRWSYTYNVALHHLAYPTSLSSFGVAHQWRKEHQALFAEQGSGINAGKAFATAYLKPSPKEHLWGYAHYLNGERRGVRYNSTSDIGLLYPYIVSDNVGGDLQMEEYSFGGGYSRAVRMLHLAGQLTYSAAQEYRRVDPRPRNITSHLEASIGASMPIAGYAVGLSGGYGIYKQRSSIAIYSPSGGTTQRLMSGLGDSFVRFDGQSPSVYYRSHSLYSQVALVPFAKTTGVVAQLEYRYRHLGEILSDMNEVPIHHYNEHLGAVSIGYSGRQWGVEIRGELKQRAGVEHIVGEPKGGTYPVVGYLHNFKGLEGSEELSIYLSGHSAIGWYGRFSLGYHRMDIYKLAPEKKLQSQAFSGTLSGGIHYSPSHRQLITLSAEVGYRPKGNGTLQLPYATMAEQDIEHLQWGLATLTSEAVTTRLSPGYTLTFGKGAKEWGLRLTCDYRYRLLRHPVGGHLTGHRLLSSVQLIF